MDRRLLDRDDRDHARLSQRRLVVDGGDRRPEPCGVKHDGGHHPGETHVDRETGTTKDLAGGIDAQPPLVSNQLELGRVLQAHILRNRQLLRKRGQLSKARLPPAGVREHPPLDRDLRHRHLPRLRRRRHQPRPRLGAGLPVAEEGALDRIARAGELKHPTDVGVAVDVAAGARPIGRVDHANRIKVRVELLRHRVANPVWTP
jgi:hypothetical protein